MKKVKVLVGLISISLLTACSSNSKELNYDEVELVRYQACIDFYLKGALDKGTFYAMAPQIVNDAQKECFQLEPKKR
jgi:hypothetical protein